MDKAHKPSETIDKGKSSATMGHNYKRGEEKLIYHPI